MSQFSAATQRVIEAFAASMDITGELTPDNTYGFEFADSGTLSLVPSQDGARIVVCLAPPPYRMDPNSHLRFLELTGFAPAIGTMVHAALGQNGDFVLAASIDESEFTVQLLDQTVSTLIETFSTKITQI